MCGIVGYVGHRAAAPLLLEGLQRLEYRGYDSSGVAILGQNGELTINKAVGKLSSLVSLLGDSPPQGRLGVGHTRWATHGKPTQANAHPHVDCRNQVVVTHNGIVENYLALKKELIVRGHTFTSQTDTEVLPHLIEDYLNQGFPLEEAVRQALRKIEGAHALLVLSTAEPEKIVAARVGNAGGLVVGYGQGESFVASDLPAILPYTSKVAFLSSLEMATISNLGVSYSNISGSRLEKPIQEVPYDPVAAAKRGYKHFMLKEIMEQPEAVLDTFRGRVSFEPPDVYLENIPFSVRELQKLSRVVIVACGTSRHAAMVGEFMIESIARLPVEVDYGSEFRYRDPLIDANTLLVSITQSGETVDTLAAMEEAKNKGAKQITICNVLGSQATRVADGAIITHAGLEIGVAATKTTTAAFTALYLLACYLAKARAVVDTDGLKTMNDDLARIPHLMGRLLEDTQSYERLANTYFRLNNFMYLGRGIHYPVALEGSHKLKEISYIHAEAYPAGEMKHGAIALIDENMPVVAVALRDHLYDKILSNIEQVKARGGTVIALAAEGDSDLEGKADHVLYVPQAPELLSPLLTILPLQLLAYYIALRRGCDVDQPRNLAKTVTVE